MSWVGRTRKNYNNNNNPKEPSSVKKIEERPFINKRWKSYDEWKKLLEECKTAVSAGKVDVAFETAEMVRYGWTLTENHMEEALPYYEIAADCGNNRSAEIIGNYYVITAAQTNDVQGMQKGMDYLLRAADADIVSAQLKASLFLSLAEDAEHIRKAKDYLYSAATKGNNDDAQFQLFKLIIEHFPVEENDSKRFEEINYATYWLAKAYRNNNYQAIEYVKNHELFGRRYFEEALKKVDSGVIPDEQ